MVQTGLESVSSPKSWGDVRMVVLGDSHVGSLSFKEVPAEDRPRLRARSFKGAQLCKLLPMVETEITQYKPHLLVMSVGFNDLTWSTCQFFKETEHQHRVKAINYEFKVNLAADEIFREWHAWLAKYNCKVLFALTFPMDFQEYNTKKLKHCPDCQEMYNEAGQREILSKRIKEWGDLLTEKNVPVMFLGDVLERMNPDYIMNDSVIEESERALIDGVKINTGFAKNFYEVIREVTEKVWPNFIGGEEENVDGTELDAPQPSPSEEGDPVLMPPKKKTKPAFRF